MGSGTSSRTDPSSGDRWRRLEVFGRWIPCCGGWACGRLLLAFLGISAFALIAAAAAIYSFSEVGGVLGRITEERVPAALDFLELSRQAERIVAAAPKLLAVSERG